MMAPFCAFVQLPQFLQASISSHENSPIEKMPCSLRSHARGDFVVRLGPSRMFPARPPGPRPTGFAAAPFGNFPERIFPRPEISMASPPNSDELRSLGVTVLWLMPVHPIGEKFRKGELGSPYSIQDYYAIDPNYGTLGDFKKLVAGAHECGMKVIMDLVANHTAWDSVMMKYPDFYKHDAQGRMIPPVPEWTDVAAINYGNPALRQYMIAMLQYWIQTCDVDGYRCDAAAMVPTEFWEQARTELIKVKPDIILLAEASKPELLTNAFDIDYLRRCFQP